MTMTLIQAIHARALAAAHYHQWASFEQTEGLVEPQEIADVIWKAAHDVEEESGFPVWIGIDRPRLEDGVVVHNTATGRLHWRVLVDGTVRLEVYRPTGIVLGVDIWKSVGAGWVAVPTRYGDFEDRHIDAVMTAACAIVEPMEAARLCDHLCSLREQDGRHERTEALRKGGCPRCGGSLTCFSPSGAGDAACDACGIVY